MMNDSGIEYSEIEYIDNEIEDNVNCRQQRVQDKINYSHLDDHGIDHPDLVRTATIPTLKGPTNATVGVFKFADETQMGGLSSLMQLTNNNVGENDSGMKFNVN